MPSPFPGMNPYFKNPQLWEVFHNRLITAIANVIREKLRPRYRVEVSKSSSIEIYTQTRFSPIMATAAVQLNNIVPVSSTLKINNYYEPTPQEEPEIIKLPGYRIVATGEIVTVIEVLSFKNKCFEEEKEAYNKNRQRILNSLTNLVEIDLLGDCEQMQNLNNQVNSDYRILVNCAECLRQETVYSFGLQDPIPTFSLPLLFGDRQPSINLQALIHEVYDDVNFDINYIIEPNFPLNKADAAWADKLLRSLHLR
jgi:hypothetical protein